MAQKHLEIDPDMYKCFNDYAKALDRVHHIQIIKCLEKIGIDGNHIRKTGNLYWQQRAAKRVGDDLSLFTDIKEESDKNVFLFPYLFNIYTEFIFRNSNDLEGTCINGHNVNNLRYADDTALLANTECKLQEIVNILKEKSSKVGLEMNVKKTKTMLISTNPMKKNVKVSDTTLEQAKQFKYHDTQITEKPKREEEIKCKINLAKAKFGMMTKDLTSHKLSTTLKLRLTNCYVFCI